MKVLAATVTLLALAGCGAQAAPNPHDGQVRALAGDGTNVGRLDEAAVRIKLGAPDLRKRETIAGVRYVEMNYTPPGCSFFFDATSGLLARAEC